MSTGGQESKSSARMLSYFRKSHTDESLEEDLLPKQHQHNGGEEAAASEDSDEERCMRQRLERPEWTLDRGAGYYWEERMKNKKPCLVETGRRAGRSRVQVLGVGWNIMFSHVVRRDFFNAAVNASLVVILGFLVLVYNVMLCSWGLIYYATWRYDEYCFEGFNGYLSALLFAMETQQTIGFGARAPGECWITAALVGTHSLLAVVLNSIILGIAFARIAHPKNRGRTVLISDCAVIARRNGMLKFMFRVADIQRLRQVINPRVNAYLYTWGHGTSTLEGEHIPVRVQELRIDYLDPTLLLPVSVEHTIDERSPLAGHTQQTLADINGEVVVVLQGSTELGNTFMIRSSYLAQEIHYGHTFVPIIIPARDGQTQHSIDIARFHDVEPQPYLDMVPPRRLSQKVVQGGDRKTIPTPTLAENTFVLSDDMVVAPRNGRLYLMIRVGDSYGDLQPCSQMVNTSLTAYIYRWQSHTTLEGETLPFTTNQLIFEPHDLSLRYPMTVLHEIKPGSPIAGWTSAQAKRQDVNAEIVVTIRGTCYATNHVYIKTKSYPLLTSVKWGHTFVPVVMPNVLGGMAAPRVDWSNFHHTQPLSGSGHSSPPVTAKSTDGLPAADGRGPLPISAPPATFVMPAHGRQVTVQGQEGSHSPRMLAGIQPAPNMQPGLVMPQAAVVSPSTPLAQPGAVIQPGTGGPLLQPPEAGTGGGGGAPSAPSGGMAVLRSGNRVPSFSQLHAPGQVQPPGTTPALPGAVPRAYTSVVPTTQPSLAQQHQQQQAQGGLLVGSAPRAHTVLLQPPLQPKQAQQAQQQAQTQQAAAGMLRRASVGLAQAGASQQVQQQANQPPQHQLQPPTEGGSLSQRSSASSFHSLTHAAATPASRPSGSYTPSQAPGVVGPSVLPQAPQRVEHMQGPPAARASSGGQQGVLDGSAGAVSAGSSSPQAVFSPPFVSSLQQNLAGTLPGATQAHPAATGARIESTAASGAAPSSVSDGERQSTPTSGTPGFSAEHSLLQDPNTRGHAGGSSRQPTESWRETRSLFTALEEMRKLSEQQGTPQQQHQQQQNQQHQQQ